MIVAKYKCPTCDRRYNSPVPLSEPPRCNRSRRGVTHTPVFMKSAD